MRKIILASTSKYRKEQLERLNLKFELMAPNVDEEELKLKEIDHKQLSRTLAELKARAISKDNLDAIVIGGDQVASFKNEIMGKPVTEEQAFQQLKALSGEVHHLYTSVAIISNNQEPGTHTCAAKMRMRKLSDSQIERYIHSDQALDCCGAYRLEALGISLFEDIQCNDYSSIIGVPLIWTVRALSKLGIVIP